MFHVDHLYINRQCTGAMSGTHAKVGGPDSLFWFVQTKTVAQRY